MAKWESFEAFLREAGDAPVENRQALVDDLLRERLEWPWIEENKASFIYVSTAAQRVALNLDTIEGDPPFAPLQKLAGTTLWYITQDFENDALLDYLLAIDDPMTPLSNERDILGRIERHWRIDPLNTTRMNTANMNVSVLRMKNARPFPDWAKLNRVNHGKTQEHLINSAQLGFTNRRVWVYTPPHYDENPNEDYPLLLLSDGQWGIGPLQVPYIADALIKHNKMQPIIIAMIESGDQKDRIKTYVSNDKHYTFLLTEILPFLQTQYRVDPSNLGLGGVAVGAIAAAHAALKNPAIFSHLIMISPPLGRGIAQEKLREYAGRFQNAKVLPRRIFQSVGRYETRSRFYLPAQVLHTILNERADVNYRYVEVGSGHGLVAFRAVLPEALAWAFPANGDD